MLTFTQWLKKRRDKGAKDADEVLLDAANNYLLLNEGRPANFDSEIRIDRNTHMRTGERHAHIYDRKGNELYALTHDGKPSHGSQPFKLNDGQAQALRDEGFSIPDNNIVEAILIGPGKMVLLG